MAMTQSNAAPSIQGGDGPALDRRAFLQIGLTGSVLLGIGGVAATLSGCGGKQAPPAKGYFFLRDADVVLFTALTPVLLKGLPMDAKDQAEVMRRIDGACLLTDAPAQVEVYKLFDLLNSGLTRRLTAGVNVPWEQASEEQIEAFLTRWRESSVGLFNSGYRVLGKLATVSYFCMPKSWAASGYPGPLASMYKAVNA
jgi:hypothetical protein